MRRWTATVTALLWVAGTGIMGGCDGTVDSDPTRSDRPGGSAPAASSAAPAPAPPPGSPSPGGTAAGWTTGTVTVDRAVPVPPVPRLLAIRPATHPGYDRITFDFAGPLPGYRIGYLDKIMEDGSGRVVAMPGRRYLQIRFQQAQAHADDGGAAVTPRRQTLDYPMLRGYVVNGDFEGVVNVALGLDDMVAFRVGEIPGTPGRIYVDVAA